MKELAGTAFAVFLLALIVEALLEYVVGIWWKPLANETRKKVVMAVGLVLGIALSLNYAVDIPEDLGLQPSLMGKIVTGALIGRGSEFIHVFYNMVKNVGKPAASQGSNK